MKGRRVSTEASIWYDDTCFYCMHRGLFRRCYNKKSDWYKEVTRGMFVCSEYATGEIKPTIKKKEVIHA